MNSDINVLRGIATIFVMIGFIGVCIWAYSSQREEEFSQAALMPFADDDDDNDVAVTAGGEKTVSGFERG